MKILFASGVLLAALLPSCTTHQPPLRGQITDGPAWVALPTSNLLATIHEGQNRSTTIEGSIFLQNSQLLDYLSHQLAQRNENNILFIASTKVYLGPDDPLPVLRNFCVEHNLNLFYIPATGKEIPEGLAEQIVVATGK